MGVRIQFIGLVGSGKSYLSSLLATKKNGYVIPFAKRVYELAALVKGESINKSLSEDRELLKIIGTTWGRESKILSPEIQNILNNNKPKNWGTPDIWAKEFIDDCQSLNRDISIFNDDTRFENELRIAGVLGGFIPIFVACTEKTRYSRLTQRGDKKDPNDPKHKSEMLVNKLCNRVLEDDLMTVVWNDDIESKPSPPWILDKDTYISLTLNCKNNEELGKYLNWNQKSLDKLLAFAKEE